MTQGARIIGVDGTTAVIVYQGGGIATSTTRGKVITLASATSLSLGSEQVILSNASYNGQFIQGLASPYANHFVITGFNTDYGRLTSIAFTRSSNTLTAVASDVAVPIQTTAQSQVSGLVSYVKNRVLGNIFINTNTTAIVGTPAVAQGMGIVVENSYNINATSSGSILSPTGGGAIVDMFACGGSISEKTSPYVETDTHVIFGQQQAPVEKLFIYSKKSGEMSSIILDGLAVGSNTTYSLKNSIAKVRDGQYLVILNLPSSYYLHYLPILIDGVD